MYKIVILTVIPLVVIYGLLIVLIVTQKSQQNIVPRTWYQSPNKQVALTFDDGPYGTPTLQILAILKKEHVHATFFVTGSNVNKYPNIAKQIVNDGNVIANHSYDHTEYLTKMTLLQIHDELSKTDSAIASSTGVHTKLFRPPYGNMSPYVQNELTQEGYTTIMWNVDTRDWDYTNSSSTQIIQTIMSNLKSHEIIIMHDGRDTHRNYPRDNTITALPIIIENLKSLGYTFLSADAVNINM